jgi:hypothetical protein
MQGNQARTARSTTNRLGIAKYMRKLRSPELWHESEADLLIVG